LIEQLAYLHDPLTLEFTAKILHKRNAADGTAELILEQTYFYPTGGGQSHDTGTLGVARVIDVFKDEAGNVVHKVDRDVGHSLLPAQIDERRRWGNMQHHSAQHILSAVCEQRLGLETLSARISADTPSTIDVPLVDLAPAELERVENYANTTIFENRAIKSYVITGQQVDTVPFRRPPKVKGQIRVVEIESLDYSACGGTHCPHTGMVGLIKIVKTENRNQKLRIHFVAGEQALVYFQTSHQIVSELSRNLSTGPAELVDIVTGQAEQLRLAQKEISRLEEALLRLEAERLAEQAEPFERYHLVLKQVDNYSPAALRELAKLLQQEPGVIAVLTRYEDGKLSVVVSCAVDTRVSAKTLLLKQLAPMGGRGGGDKFLAQGGGAATAQQIEALFDQTREHILAAEI